LSDAPSLFQEEPKTFHLTKNYRSHGGIVRCAQSVIELITNFWPNAIDVLSREAGVVDGCKPVFFSGWDSSTVRYVSGQRLFSLISQCFIIGAIFVWRIVSTSHPNPLILFIFIISRGNPVEFGAQQCVSSFL
jgi:hypothetical protein